MRAPDSDADATALAKLQPSLVAADTSAYAAASSCLSFGSPQDDAEIRETEIALASRTYREHGLTGGGRLKTKLVASLASRRVQHARPLSAHRARNAPPAFLSFSFSVRYISNALAAARAHAPLSARSLSESTTSAIIAACAPPLPPIASSAPPTAEATALALSPPSATVNVCVSASAICLLAWSRPVSDAAPAARPALNASVSPSDAAASSARAAPSTLPSQPTNATSETANADARRWRSGRLGQVVGQAVAVWYSGSGMGY